MEIGVHRLGPNNSTYFTDCCGCAICSDQKRCPRCEKLIIGHDELSAHKRDFIRWAHATEKKRMNRK